jgi:hypothetical protein
MLRKEKNIYLITWNTTKCTLYKFFPVEELRRVLNSSNS